MSEALSNKSQMPLLRVPRSDSAEDTNQFILLRAKTYKGASNPLDVYLLATEGESAYGLKIKQTQIHKFIHKAFTGTHEEFKTILSAILLQTPVPAEEKPLLEGVGFSATIDDSGITLALRKSVGGIKQRLAVIEIPQTEDEISLYDWTGELCSARDESQAKLQSLEEKAKMYEKQIEKLITQVKDLTTLKKEHEDSLLLKFQELLNSKKQRIRDLNHIIEGRGVSPKVESIEIKEESPAPAPVSKGKGKSKNPRKRPATPIDEDESDGGFVSIPPPRPRKVEEEPPESGAETDRPSTAGATSAEDEPPKPTKKKVALKGRAKATPAAAARGKKATSAAPSTRGGKKTATRSTTAPPLPTRRRRKATASVEPESSGPEVEVAASPVIRAASPEKDTEDAAMGDDPTAGETDDDEL